MKRAELAKLIDHTALGPTATAADIKQICTEARRDGFAAVCVSPYHVPLAGQLLAESEVKVCTVIGFPHGCNVGPVKAMETKQAIDDGADELDMVINIAALKQGDYHIVLDEIQLVSRAIEKCPRPLLLKIILETTLLTTEEKIAGAILAKAAGADFVKTSTGFAQGGATVEDVSLLRRTVGKMIGVKASGGIRDYHTAIAMIEAGATRIGTSSGPVILHGAEE
ncbi:TPA: deoxyribose-phosphate aldolase [Candidatus Acetothermia bacterium]|nr:deoxyribose-phosphate aldolase [Candidatus Acetothermia bacterium]